MNRLTATGSGWKKFAVLLPVCLMTACSTLEKDRAPKGEIDISGIPDAVPKMEQRSRYGNPDSYEVNGQHYYVLDNSRGYFERGTASWYGEKFHGRRTSSGETYNMYAMTAAHRTLPLPTYVRVTNLENGRSIVVKVNDRGPFHDNRLIDLSYVAAAKLDMLHKGTAPVEVRAIDPYQVEPAGEISVHAVTLEIPESTAIPIQAALPPRPGLQDDVENAQFYVQMGAFSEQQNAEMLRSAVVAASEKAENIHIQQGSSAEGKILYKVRVGPLASREEAIQLKERLAATGISGPHIVTE